MAAIVAIAGGLMMGIGAFLPWITASSGFGSVSRGAMEGGDGVIVLGAAAVVVVGGLVSLSKWYGWVAGAIGSLLGGAVGVIDFQDVQECIDLLDTEFVVAEVGIGLWMVLAGATTGLLGAAAVGYLPRDR